MTISVDWNVKNQTKITQQCGCASHDNSDQPRHQFSLIRVFAVCKKKAWVLSYPMSAQQRLRSAWVDAQADLSLCSAHNNFVGFIMSRLIFFISERRSEAFQNMHGVSGWSLVVCCNFIGCNLV